MENRTLKFTFNWLHNHRNSGIDATSLVNYMHQNNIRSNPFDIERHIDENNDNITVISSDLEDFTKLIFKTEEDLIEFLLKYG